MSCLWFLSLSLLGEMLGAAPTQRGGPPSSHPSLWFSELELRKKVPASLDVPKFLYSQTRF